MRCLIAVILCLITLILQSQQVYNVGGVPIRHFQISEDIEFVKVGEDIDEIKPVFLLLQGSQPVPLIIDYGESKSLSSFPFDVSQIKEEYHLIVISKPHVPLSIHVEELKDGAIYRDPERRYNKANHLTTYLDRSNAVISYLTKLSWVDSEKMLIFGHSEGSTIAVHLKDNPHVTDIVIAASNPMGRIYENILELRAHEDAGKIRGEESQARINELYNRWSHIVANQDDDTAMRGDTFKATFSFSKYLVDDITSISQPLMVIYGTRDLGSRSCDYLPIAFASAGKTNYKMLPMEGRGHNFESFDENGLPNYEDMAWDKVINQVLDWAR